MKKISEHLGELIAALAGIVLLIGCIAMFSAPIGDFFENIVDKETNIGNKVLGDINVGDMNFFGPSILYTLEEIENSDGHLVPIGKSNLLNVVAVFNEDFTSVEIVKNIPNSDGLMRDFDEDAPLLSPLKYNVPYILTTDDSTAFIFYEDGSLEFYVDGEVSDSLPAGTVAVNGTDILVDGDIVMTVSADGTEITLDDDTYVLSEAQPFISFGPPVKEDPMYEHRATLQNVIILNGVRNIGAHTFYECSNLTSIDIPNSVQVIGENAFYRSGLLSITIPDTVTSIDGVFAGCFKVKTIKLGNSIVNVGDYAFEDCSNLISITFSDSIKTIGEEALYQCKKLTTITFGNSLEKIGASAFAECTALTTVTIPNSVKTIGYRAFSGCTNLASVVMPSSLETLGGYAFENCTSLTSVVLPSVKVISEGAFNGCTGVTSITIPKSVAQIQTDIFRLTTGKMTCIIFEGTTAEWQAIDKETGYYASWNMGMGRYIVHCTDGHFERAQYVNSENKFVEVLLGSYVCEFDNCPSK